MQEINARTSEFYTLQLPSKPESIILLENLTERIADKHRVREDIFANMMICLNEIATNAIVHGNKLDEIQKVIVNAEIDADRIIWTIADVGEGFNYNCLSDPTTGENLENLGGRGVFIVKKLADQCIFNSKGNEVELHFKI